MTPSVPARHWVTYGTRGVSSGMKPVPAFHRVTLAIQLLVARDAPDVGGHVVLLGENLLRLDRLVQNRAAAEQLGARLRLLLCAGRTRYMPFRMPSRAPSGIGGISYCSFITVM